MATNADKLAIEGGTPVNERPFPMWPQFDLRVIGDIEEVLGSGKVNYWTGELGMKFEEEWAKWCGAQFAVSTTNGTSALHTALAGLGIV